MRRVVSRYADISSLPCSKFQRSNKSIHKDANGRLQKDGLLFNLWPDPKRDVIKILTWFSSVALAISQKRCSTQNQTVSWLDFLKLIYLYHSSPLALGSRRIECWRKCTLAAFTVNSARDWALLRLPVTSSPQEIWHSEPRERRKNMNLSLSSTQQSATDIQRAACHINAHTHIHTGELSLIM